jgi:uncharacterized protein YndB with AHSA1/START domain
VDLAGQRQIERTGSRFRKILAAICLTACLAACLTAGRAFADAQAGGAVYRLDVVIDAPAEFIYPYLIEEDKIARWNQDDGVTVTFPRGTEPRVGKQVRVVLDAPTHPWMLMEIDRLEPGRAVATKFVDGVLGGSFSYFLAPAEDGRTRLVHEMRIRPKGALTTILWELFGKNLHRRKMRGFLDRIRNVVETDWKSDPANAPSRAF